MANTKYKRPKLKFTIWYRLISIVAFLGMGDMKWTEKVIAWLVKNKKVCAKLGTDNIYFE
jgi:hypothetical protein